MYKQTDFAESTSFHQEINILQRSIISTRRKFRLSGDVIMHYVNTVNNIADIFTKALGRQVVDTVLRMLLGYDPDHFKMILKAADIKHTESSTTTSRTVYD